MEPCLSALAALEAGFSRTLPPNHPNPDSEETLWEAACHWAATAGELGQAQGHGQEHLLGAAAEVAGLLAATVSNAQCAAEAHGNTKACSTEAGPQPAMTGYVAAAAKAAQGLVTLVRKQPPSVNTAEVQRIADSAAAVLLSSSSLAVDWEKPSHLEAVACLANMLLQLASDTARPASVRHALARADGTSGVFPALLRTLVRSLGLVPVGQDSAGWQAVRRHATYMAIRLQQEASLREQSRRVTADGELVQQLLRLVVVPSFADVLQMGSRAHSTPPWAVSGLDIMPHLMSAEVRPHARSVLAEAAAPLSSAFRSAAPVAEVASGAAAGAAPLVKPTARVAAAAGNATYGGTLVLLGVEVLAELRTVWKQARKAERSRQERMHEKSQQEAQGWPPGGPSPSGSREMAAEVAHKALLLTGAMQLLPCVLFGVERPPLQQQSPCSQATACAGSGSSNNMQAAAATPAVPRKSQPAAEQPAARAAEPACLQGVVAVAGALHDLVDSGTVPQLVCSVECLPAGGQDDMEVTAARTVQCLAIAAAAFDGWSGDATQPSGDSWVPQDVGCTCAAAEALLRLVAKLPRGAPLPGVPPEDESELTPPRMILGAVNRCLLALKEHVSASDNTQQSQGGFAAMEDAAAAPLTPTHAPAALQPAVHLAFSTVKFYHAARTMPSAQKQSIFGGDDTLMMVLCSVLMMTASRVARLLEEAYAVPQIPKGVARDLLAMNVSVLEAVGVFATDAAAMLAQDTPAARRHSSNVMSAVIELTNTAFGAFTSDSTSFILLAPKAVEAALRMLLVNRALSEDGLDGYRFWDHVGDWFEECPRLCAEVVKTGVLSDSAVWLAGQLQRGAAQRRLSPPAATKLAGSLHALLLDAVRGLAQLTAEFMGPRVLSNQMVGVVPGIEGLLEELHKAGEAAVGAGQERISTPSFWSGLAAPGGLATLLTRVATTIADSLLTAPVETYEANLQLARVCAHRPCSNRACPELTGASESELHHGRRCSRCKEVYYCGVGCQRAAWPEHKLVCKLLQDV